MKYLLVLLIFHPVFGDFYERRVVRKLLDDYEVLERPVSNGSMPVTIFLGVILQQLIDVDEKNQIITVNCWLKYTWTDYSMRWDPDEFGGITDIRLPMGKLWKPDVLLYNSVDSNFDSTYPSNMVVYSNGMINWIPPGIFKISCKIDITYFPFDEQLCYFKFGSWTYDGTKLDLRADEGGFDMSEYLSNGEWSLLETTVHRNEKFYDCCPEPYPDLKFYIRMRRRTLYFVFNLVMPCILITWMTIVGFTLPPDAGEKVTLQVTVLLSICFFLNIVAEMSPPTSEAVPLLGAFFSCCLIIVSASVVLTVFILNVHHRTSETHEMGNFTRKLLLHWIPWLFFMNRPGFPLTYKDLPPLFGKKKKKEDNETLIGIKSKLKDRHSRRHSMELEHRINQCLKALTAHQPQLTVGAQAQLLMLQRIYTELKYVTKRMADSDEENYIENEWKFAAMVVDRFCMFMFASAIIASLLFVLIRAPYLNA